MPFSVSLILSMTHMKPLASYSLTIVGNTLSRRSARALRLKGFSMARMLVMVFPFIMALCIVVPFLVFAFVSASVRFSGFIPVRVPVYVSPCMVVIWTVLSSRVPISVKSFLWAVDMFCYLYVLVY